MALTDNWNLVSGAWTIVAGRLYEPSTTGIKKIIGLTPVPADSGGEMHITVDMCDPVYGDEYYIFLACADTSGAGGEYVLFTYDSLNTWKVELSTGEWKYMTFDPPGVETVWRGEACIDSDGFLYGRIQSSGDEYPWTDAAGVQAGRYYGLGHGTTTSGIYFDNFNVEELRNGTEICVECFCHCDANNVGKILHGTIAGVDRADCMDGKCVEFNWEWNSGTPRWVSDVLSVGSNVFKWIWSCASFNPAAPFDGFLLSYFPGASPNYKACCAADPLGCDGISTPDPDLSDCEPTLSLVYGPFRFSKELSCDACYGFFDDAPETGDWYMTITEDACP